MNVELILHQALFGAISAAGFGVLFNVGLRALPWCAASGLLTLAVRSFCLELGVSLEGASFAAALAAGLGARFLSEHTEISRTALAVAGCIPMVPGSFAAKAILGFFALTAGGSAGDQAMFADAALFTLRVLFTTGAIATGLAIPTLLLPSRQLQP